MCGAWELGTSEWMCFSAYMRYLNSIFRKLYNLTRCWGIIATEMLEWMAYNGENMA